ncbi:regular [Cochliomyia hominivorax]
MSELLSSPIIWQPDDYIYFKKCGEITISPDIQNIGFNCLFCSGICLQFDIFLQHLQEQHREDVFKLYENQNVKLPKPLSPQLSVGILENENAHNPETKESNLSQNFNIEEISSKPLTDLNLISDFVNNDFLPLNSTTNQDLEFFVTFNPLENLNNNNSTTSLLTSTFTEPSNVISASSVDYLINSLPDDNECEMGDGEDSGIMLAQSPCNSDCAAFSDCMSFTEDNSCKSTNNYSETSLSPGPELGATHQESAAEKECARSSKAKYLKTSAMSKALDNKPLIEYLLEIYRKNEKLWNPQHPDYKYNAHRSIFNELTQPLLRHMKHSLTGEEIFGIITHLRGRYRRELKKFETRKGKHKTRLWYFEKIDFLRAVIEEKRKERCSGKDKKINTNLSANNDELTQRQILSGLLDIYRQHEAVWNPKHKDYEASNKGELFENIAEELRKRFNINLTVKECENEIQKLRIRYRKELRVFYKLKGLYLPKLWCFDEMEFLRSQMEEKINKNLKKTSNHTISTLNQRKHDFLKASEITFENLQQQLQFIEIYRNFKALWDVNHPDYRSSNFRRKTLNEMLENVNTTLAKRNKYKLPQIEKTIYILRKEFSLEKHKHLMDVTPTKDNSGMSPQLYEKLNEFLAAHVGPFRCVDCQQICKTYDQYKIHKSKHDGTLPFICPICGKGFQIPGNLTIHIRRHRQDFPYSCQICHKSFATSTEVSIHTRSHTGERPYVCEWCNKTFKTWSFCDLHRRTHLKQSNLFCPICDKTFYERNRFTDHMNVHLNIRKHQCDHCVKSFTTMGNLRKHLNLLHTNIERYKCQSSDKGFAQLSNLKWHQTAQHEI